MIELPIDLWFMEAGEVIDDGSGIFNLTSLRSGHDNNKLLLRNGDSCPIQESHGDGIPTIQFGVFSQRSLNIPRGFQNGLVLLRQEGLVYVVESKSPAAAVGLRCGDRLEQVQRSGV
jgi:hypothetical protein